MRSAHDDTTPSPVLAAYDALVQACGTPALEAEVRALREAFQRRTGAFRADDPSAEVDARTRAFWDDALTAGGLASAAAERVRDEARDAVRELFPALGRAHRGLFVVESLARGRAHLSDLWSGAELFVTVLDDTQALALEHADGPFDGRVVAARGALALLPGAFHHPADALEHLPRLLDAARDLGLTTGTALDALLRMERVLRTSSRVKAAFAYRVEALSRERASGRGVA